MSKGTCKFDGCSGTVVGKGYCARHYTQWRRGGLPKGRYKICTAEGCRKPRASGSKCTEHVKGKAAAPEAGGAAATA
jgi:hypothetical protein